MKHNNLVEMKVYLSEVNSNFRGDFLANGVLERNNCILFEYRNDIVGVHIKSFMEVSNKYGLKVRDLENQSLETLYGLLKETISLKMLRNEVSLYGEKGNYAIYIGEFQYKEEEVVNPQIIGSGKIHEDKLLFGSEKYKRVILSEDISINKDDAIKKTAAILKNDYTVKRTDEHCLTVHDKNKNLLLDKNEFGWCKYRFDKNQKEIYYTNSDGDIINKKYKEGKLLFSNNNGDITKMSEPSKSKKKKRNSKLER
jgi:hypothetical protein